MSTKVAIILAAGAGKRMGGSKALLLVDGQPLAKAHAARAIEAGCERAVIVMRPDVASRLGDVPRATILSEVTSSQAESLKRAVRKIGRRGDVRVMITPVDCPPVSAATLRALFAALEEGADVVTPRRGSVGGHPVVCRGAVLTPYTTDDASPPTLRDVLTRHESAHTRIDVDDPRVGIDLDTPEDVTALTGQGPVFLESTLS